MIYKYFLPFGRLSFHFVDISLLCRSFQSVSRLIVLVASPGTLEDSRLGVQVPTPGCLSCLVMEDHKCVGPSWGTRWRPHNGDILSEPTAKKVKAPCPFAMSETHGGSWTETGLVKVRFPERRHKEPTDK